MQDFRKLALDNIDGQWETCNNITDAKIMFINDGKIDITECAFQNLSAIINDNNDKENIPLKVLTPTQIAMRKIFLWKSSKP